VNDRARDEQTPLRAWVRELFRGPQLTAGDYFERLQANVESSAPVGTACRP
jgi:hypothetical protein